MESFFSIDLNGQSTANAELKVSDSPMPQIGNLATQLELRLQLFPALSARHTSEIAALLEWHRTGRDTIDQLHAKDSDALEARHMAERAALLESYQVSRERHEQRFAQDSAAMQTKQLSEIQAFLQQNMALYQDMISALAQQRLQQQAEADALAKEKAEMEAPGISGGDILQLNVGGESFVVTRGTLTQAKGSVLASKFNGRWEAKHQVDSQGQIFLDYDPYCFKQVLAYLRSKAIERPDRPAPQPAIAPESQAQFNALLQYLGLEEFMGKHWYLDKASSGLTMSDIRTTLEKRTASGCDESCLLAPAMPFGKAHYVKFQVLSYDGQGLFFGVTQLQDLAPQQYALAGWSTSDGHSLLKHGDWNTKADWTGWQEGDKVLFKVDLVSHMLYMYCARFGKAFSLPLSKIFSSSIGRNAQPILFRVVMRGVAKVRLLPVLLQDMQELSNIIK